MTVPSLEAVRREKARRTLQAFTEYTTDLKLHEWQKINCRVLDEEFVGAKGARLLIHGPPQFGKSIILSKRLPAYILGKDPLARVASFCYNKDHATSFTAANRDLMASEMYEALFPGLGIKPDMSAADFSTVQRQALMDSQASLKAYGLLTGVTGRGADYVLIDDPYASPEEASSVAINEKVWRFWDDNLKNRISEETNVVVMFHRYHGDDLVARLIKQDSRWKLISFPAIADGDPNDPTGREIGEPLSPIRSIGWLREREAENPYTFAALFQGKPMPAGSGLFKEAHFSRRETEHPTCTRYVRFFDLAVSVKQTADFTAGALVGTPDMGDLAIFDVRQWRAEWPDSRERIIQTALDDIAMLPKGANYSLVLEKQGTQLALVQDLSRDPRLKAVPLWGHPAKGDKKQRAALWAAKGSLGKLILVAGPWIQPLVDQALAFRGDDIGHDDMVDAVSGAVEVLYQTEEQPVHEREIDPNSLEFFNRFLMPENDDYADEN